MDESVKIPISLQVDDSDLGKLQADIDKIVNAAERVANKRSTSPFDSARLKDNINQLRLIESLMGNIQQKLANQPSNIGEEYDTVRLNAEKYEKLLTQIIQDQKSAKASLGGYSKAYKDALAYAERMGEEIKEIQSVAKSAGRELTDDEKERIKNIQFEVDQRRKSAESNLEATKNHLDSLQADEAGVKELLSLENERKKELLDILDDEQKSVEYNEQLTQKTAELNGQLEKAKNLYTDIGRSAKDIVEANGGQVKGLRSAEFTAPSTTNKPVKDTAVEDLNARIAALNKERAAIKQSAAQYYYKLRAIKMLGFTLNNINTVVDNFGKKAVSSATKALNAYLKLIPGASRLQKALSGATSNQSKLNKETKNLTKSNQGLNLSFGQLIKKILAYGIGIRSVYMLFSKLRKAVSEGMGSMAKQISDVNMQMSSVVTSMNQMKAAVTAAIQPILSVLAPALERVAAAVAEIAYQVASFIATLTGQSVVYKASRVWTDYAASLDKTGKSAKNAKKELAGFDELNVLHTKDDSGNDFGGMAWDPVEISQKAADLANKLKEIWNRLLEPLKKSWNKFKDFIIKSWKYALTELKNLGDSVARDFWRVWEETDTQKIFDNLMIILGDIGLIVGNLAKNFRKAWDANENGYRILASIRDIIGSIIDGIRTCADYTVLWSNNLDFLPAMNALADNMQQKLVPAVQQVVDLFTTLYTKVLLKIIKDFIEKGLPQLENILGNITMAIGSIAGNIDEALNKSHNATGIVENLEKLIGLVVDQIEYCSQKTAEWATQLDFGPLFSTTKQMLADIEPLISAIADAASDLWTNTLLPFYQYFIEKGLPNLMEVIGEIGGGDWSNFSKTAKELTEALEPFFELAWETLVQIIKDLGLAIKDFLNSDELATIVQKFKEWVEDADPEELAKKIEHAVKAFIEIKAALALLSKVILPAIEGMMTLKNVSNIFSQSPIEKKIADLAANVAKLNGETTAASNGGIASLVEKFTGLLQNLDLVNPQLLSTMGTIGGIAGVVGGAIISIANFSDMMVNGFSAGNEAAMLLGIAITAVGAILLGAPALVAGVVAAIVAAVANFVIAIQTMPEEFANKVNEFGEFIGSIPEKIEGFFSTIIEKLKDFGHNLGVKVGEWIATLPEKIEQWKENLKTFIDKVDWMELGINILKGILYIFTLPGRLLVFVIEAIANFFLSFVKGLKEGFDMHSPSKKMEPYGEMILEGILSGIKAAVSGIGQWIVTNVFTPIINAVKSAFGFANGAASKFVEIGRGVLTGIRNGITNAISTVTSTASRVISSIKSVFSSGLSASTLINTGYNLLVGLINGIIDGFNRAYQRIREGCTNIVNIAKSIFQIGSPSKVFEQIGEYDMEGLTNGIEEGADATDEAMKDAMDNLVPDSELNADFTQNFLDKLTSMKQDAIDIVNSMAEEMQNSMANIFSGNFDIASQMSKLNAIKVPSIAQGQVLPSTASFVSGSGQNEQDYTSLANAISSALIDAMTTTRYNNTDSGDTVIQIDGREVFRAVKAQNQIYQKSTGKSAF